MMQKRDLSVLFNMIKNNLQQFQKDRAYFNLCKDFKYPLKRNSEVDVLLNWERATQIALARLEIHLGLVDYGPDKEEALKFVEENYPQFKYEETEG